MALPDGLLYGEVRWKAVTPVADGADADGLPDAQPVTGYVSFTPSAPHLLVPGVTPVTVVSVPLTFSLDENGVLRDSEGRDGVTLVATDSPNVSPQGWTWRADYILHGGITRGSFSFTLAGDSTVDLTTVAPVTESGGVAITRGETGPAGPQGEQGPAGDGVPAGGTAGQVILHNGTTTEWIDATDAAGPGTVVRRDATGGANFAWAHASGVLSQDGTPSATTHLAPKGYVDAADAALQTAVDGKAATAHGHAIADVTSLQTTLDGKAATSHGHAIADVTGLQTALDGKAASSHSHSVADVPAGSTLTVTKHPTTGWPARPTARADIVVAWKGPDPSPAIVASGTGGMLDDVDYRIVTP